MTNYFFNPINFCKCRFNKTILVQTTKRIITLCIHAHPTQYCFFHLQHLTHDIRCKQTDGRSEAREMDSGTHVLNIYITLTVSFQTECWYTVVAVCVSDCRQLAMRRPLVCICQTVAREPGPSSALSIRELSPAGSPHRCCAY